MKLSERLQGLKEEISNEITLSPDLEDAMDRCVEAARHLENKVERVDFEVIPPRPKESYGLNVQHLSIDEIKERYPDLSEHQIHLLKSYSEALPKLSDCAKNTNVIFGTGKTNMDDWYKAEQSKEQEKPLDKSFEE